MARERRKPAPADKRRVPKKKTSILVNEKVDYIDYKDINLLRRFMSERAKIRARRVTGNDQQQQAAVARAIKVAREMALLPYSVRQVTQRSKGKRGDRGDRGDRGELRIDTQMPIPPSDRESSGTPPESGVSEVETADIETTDIETTEAAGDAGEALAVVGAEAAEGGDES